MPTANVVIPVPISGFGAAVDVSALVGEKTVILSGRYQGAYVLYGTHDGSHFAPLLIFNAGGIESIRQTFSGALQLVRLKSLASKAVGVSANISGLSSPLDNSFTVIGPVGKGLSGAVDLGDSAYQTDLNFMGFGRLNGDVVVEGSSDGLGFNPIGDFTAEPASASLLDGGGIIEFSPLATRSKVRFVRLNVLGDVPDMFTVTIGGAQSDSGGGGETLRGAYLAGATSVDQTLPLLDANGGRVVLDASDPGFTNDVALQLVGYYGADAFELIKDGSLAMGMFGIIIGEPGFRASAPASGCVAIGRSAAVVPGGNDPRSVAIGMNALTVGENCLSIGAGAQTNVNNCIAIGPAAMCTVFADNSIAMGNNAISNGHSNVVIGDGASLPVLFVGDGVAVGHSATVLGGSGVAVGYGAVVIVSDGVAMGTSAQSNGMYSIAIGHTSGVFGEGGIAVGVNATISSGDHSISIGETSSAAGNSNVVMGVNATSTGDSSTVVGGSASSAGDRNTVIGNAASVSVGYSNSVAIGLSASVMGNEAIAIGHGATSNSVGGAYGIAIGDGSSAENDQSISIGFSASAFGPADLVIGPTCSANAGLSSLAGQNVVIGNNSHSDGQDSIVIGDTSSAVTGNNMIVIGRQAGAAAEASIVVGQFSKAYGSYSVAMGYDAEVGTSIYPVSYSVVIGFESRGGENYGVAIGYQATVDPLASGSVVIGNSIVGGSQSVVIGDLAESGVGLANVAIGKQSMIEGVGGANTCVGYGSQIGDPVGETRDFHNNVRVGSGFGMYSNTSIAIGNNVSVGTTLDLAIIEYCVAVGSGTMVTGSYGMAFGFNATAAANEVVFGSPSAGAVSRFEVVSSSPSNPDLISLDVSKLTGKNTTVMTLLIEQDDGITVAAVPVTLSAPSGGYSNLQVANS